MKKIMAENGSQDFSSRRHFHWTNKVSNEEDEEEELPPLKPSPNPTDADKNPQNETEKATTAVPATAPEHPAASSQRAKKKLQAVAVSRLRSALTVLARARSGPPHALGARVVGTLFGSRRGHVHFAFQRDPAAPPAFLVELATPISGLVREMASGLVRIALECDKEAPAAAAAEGEEKKAAAAGGQETARRRRLLEEPRWRTFCNGRKHGFAARRECGEKEWKILKAVEPISMGAGVLPAPEKEAEGGGEGEEVMYMRAKFERVVGSRDSEAFYMMNPDSNGAHELSIYLLRI